MSCCKWASRCLQKHHGKGEAKVGHLQVLQLQHLQHLQLGHLQLHPKLGQELEEKVMAKQAA